MGTRELAGETPALRGEISDQAETFAGVGEALGDVAQFQGELLVDGELGKTFGNTRRNKKDKER